MDDPMIYILHLDDQVTYMILSMILVYTEK